MFEFSLNLLTEIIDEPFDIVKPGRIELGTTVTRFPFIVDLHGTPGKSVLYYFSSVTHYAWRVHVHLVPGPRRPDRVFDHVRIGYGRGLAQDVFDGVLVRFPGIAVFAHTELHGIPRLPVGFDDFGRKTHVTRPRPVNVDKKGHRIIDVHIKTVRVKEVRLDNLKWKFTLDSIKYLPNRPIVYLFHTLHKNTL